jgi:hypothetical protein
MKTGRLSYTTGVNGDRRIDATELDRVFGVKSNGAMPDAMDPSMRRHVTHVGAIASLRDQLDDRDATIRDLRTRLDASEEERRRNAARLASAQERITALLTDQRAPAPPARRACWPCRRGGLK